MAYRPSVHPPCPLSMLGKTKSNGFLKIPSDIKPFYDFLCNPYPILGDSHILFRAVWAPSKPREATDLSKMVDHFYRVFPCISNFSIYDLVLQHTEPPKKTNSTSRFLDSRTIFIYFSPYLLGGYRKEHLQLPRRPAPASLCAPASSPRGNL